MFDEKNITPFYSSFLKLCKEAGKSPSCVARESGISSGAPTAWKNGAVPKPAQREKLCAYFGVTDSVLLGYDGEKNPSVMEGECISDIRQQAEAFIKMLSDEQLKKLIQMAKIIFFEDANNDR